MRYRDVVLESNICYVKSAVGPDCILAGDNAQPHGSHLLDAFLEYENIPRNDWPAISPELNPIEHVWSAVERGIAIRKPATPPPKENELAIKILRKVWRHGSRTKNSVAISRIKFLLKEEMLAKWQESWNDPKTKGRFTHMLINKIKVSTHRLQCDNMLTQLVINHGYFPTYFEWFKIKSAPQSCPLCGMRAVVHGLHFGIFYGGLKSVREVVSSRLNSSATFKLMLTTSEGREALRRLGLAARSRSDWCVYLSNPMHL